MDEPASGVADVVDEDLVVQALPILDRVARRLAYQLGVPVDDLRSIGHFALIDLIRRWDPGGMPFPAFIQQRLRWAIIDGVRKETHGRRGAARARALRASAQLSAGQRGAQQGQHEGSMPPSSHTHQHRLAEALREHAVAMGIKLIMAEGRELAVTASSSNPERLTQRRAIVEALRDAIASLEDERQRIIVERYYFEGEPLFQIAERLGITKGWASRLHAAAVAILARRLRGVVSSR